MMTRGRTGEAIAKCARRAAFEQLKARQNEFASHLTAVGLPESICESGYAPTFAMTGLVCANPSIEYMRGILTPGL